jgi:predicted ATPase
LALEVAHRIQGQFDGNAVFISLLTVDTVDGILYTIAGAMGFVFYSSDDKAGQLFQYLSTKQMLLVIDNFDRLLEDAYLIADILSVAPGIKCIITSRTRLNLQEEWVRPVSGLQMSDAISLFSASARRVKPDFNLVEQREAVQSICEMVEGMPLSLELAASWTRVMTCIDILDHIRNSLDLLSTSLRNVDDRHKSIRALFDQSYGLLSPEERIVFVRLAVLRGEWDLKVAQKIAGATPRTLLELIDKSLLRSNSSGRYSMHPLIRQYGYEQLAQSGALQTMQYEHFKYHFSLMQEAKHQVLFSKHDNWYQTVLSAAENIEDAMTWALRQGNAAAVLEMCCGLWYGWFTNGLWSKGYGWFKRALAVSGEEVPCRALSLIFAAMFSSRLLNFQTAADETKEAYNLAQKMDDKIALIFVLIQQTLIVINQYEEQTKCFEQCLALSRSIRSPFAEASTLFIYGDVAREHGDLDKATLLYQRALEVSTSANILDLIAYSIGNLGRITLHAGDYRTAREHFEQSLALAREMKSRVTMADWLLRLGMTALYEGDVAQAQGYLEQNYTLWQEIGNVMGIADSLCCLAELAYHEQNFEVARRFARQSLERWTELLKNGRYNHHYLLHGLATCLLVVGKLCVVDASPVDALKAFDFAERIRTAIGFQLEPRVQAETMSYARSAYAMLPSTETEVIRAQHKQLTRLEWMGIVVELSSPTL